MFHAALPHIKGGAFAIENDPRFVADLSAALTSIRFRVEICDNGQDAWYLGDTEDFVLVALNLGVPKLLIQAPMMTCPSPFKWKSWWPALWSAVRQGVGLRRKAWAI